MTDSSCYAYVGGYAGYGYSFENCINAVSITYRQLGDYVGGIAGFANGSFTECTNSGNITATESKCVGGIVGGVSYSGDSSWSKVENSGNIVGKGKVGGIVGYIWDYYNSEYSNCSYAVAISNATNSGNISGEQYIGGIIGYIKIYADHYGGYTSVIRLLLTSPVNSGDISGTDCVGGLIGYGYSNTSNSSIIGYTSTGTVTGTTNSGNEVGTVENITLQN
jgi:hypothetical protein